MVVLFFWAHWCPDCKIEGPILASLLDEYGSRGLTVVAPTQRYGYVAGGTNATPDEETKYIVQVRDQYYPWLAKLPVPVSATDHQRYGVSSTPTVVLVDRNGIVRLYHPGRLTAAESRRQLQKLSSDVSCADSPNYMYTLLTAAAVRNRIAAPIYDPPLVARQEDRGAPVP